MFDSKLLNCFCDNWDLLHIYIIHNLDLIKIKQMLGSKIYRQVL